MQPVDLEQPCKTAGNSIHQGSFEEDFFFPDMTTYGSTDVHKKNKQAGKGRDKKSISPSPQIPTAGERQHKDMDFQWISRKLGCAGGCWSAPTHRKGIWGSHRDAGELPEGWARKHQESTGAMATRGETAAAASASISQACDLPRIPPGKALTKQVRLFPSRGIRANQWKDAFLPLSGCQHRQSCRWEFAL